MIEHNENDLEVAKLCRAMLDLGLEPRHLKVFRNAADRWADLEELFGPLRGANSGCWCMWPRVRGADYKAMDREDRRQSFRSIVDIGPPPGLLAYEDGVAVGWVFGSCDCDGVP